MEMNTRIQVEHPVTEMVTGVDLVKEQIRIAAGEPLDVASGLAPRGHAIECRINAEDPVTFAPSPGHLTTFTSPAGPGCASTPTAYEDYVVPPHYDSLVAKLIVHAPAAGRPWRAWRGRSTSSSSKGSRPRSRCIGGSSTTRSSSPAGSPPGSWKAFSPRSGGGGGRRGDAPAGRRRGSGGRPGEGG